MKTGSFKKATSLLLALVMVLGMLPQMSVGAHAAENTATNELEGKTLSILGASISTYTGISNNAEHNSTIGNNAVYYTEGRYDIYTNDTWWMQAANDLGLELLVNNSWSGSSLLYERSGTVGAYVERCIQLHNNDGVEPDIIAIQMGTNDFQYYKDTLGTADIDYDTLITDNGNSTYTYAEPVTSLEAAAIILHKITVRYPNAEVYYLNISQRVDGTDELIQSFNAELKQVVEHFDAHIVDIYGSAITTDNFDTYIGDGRVHPNKLGMDAYTEAFKRALIENSAYAVETHTVSFELNGVTADYGDNKIVVCGDSFSVGLTSADDMKVTVIMGGEDITTDTYSNGAVTIDAVTADVTISAEYTHTPRNYRWEFDGADLACVDGENALSKNDGTTTDGVFSNTKYALETAVVLQHDLPWVVEWKSEGTFQNTGSSSGARIFTSTDVNAEYDARYIFKSNTNGLIAMGEKTSTGSHNYGIALGDHGIDWTELHTYKLENRISDDGSNMIWLFVDGVEIGPMNHYYVGTTDQGATSDWLSGKDFVFPYMGTDTHGFTNCSIEYISVTEKAKENLWNGKSAVFVGDSITAGSGTTKIYYEYLEESLDFGSVTAMGVGGSCISAASDYGQSYQPLINRYQNIPSADLIVVFMGTNDYGHETPLGAIDDTEDGTFYGALNTIVPNLVETHTSSKIVFVTPLHRYGFGTSVILGTQFTSDDVANGVGATLDDYVDALKTVCANNGVSVIDLYAECTLDPTDEEVRSTYMPDGLHPNAAGHEVIAGIMESHIRSIEPAEQEPAELTEMVYGNRFAAGNDQTCRASSRINYYLKAGTVITLKDSAAMQWACTKTSDETSSSNLGYFPDSGWSDKETAVVEADGWVGFVFKYRDETQVFDLTRPLSDYITIEKPHTHTYENGVCTACGAEHPNLANYEGKVISILGDSISTFAGYIPTTDGFNLEHYARYPQDNLFTEVEHTWWMQVLTALDAKLGINDSWRSTEVYNYIDEEVNSSYDGTKACMASNTRIQNLGSNGTPDVILFFGGTNDITQSRPVGTFDPSTAPKEVDLTSVKWDTVADAYVDAIMRMQYYYPEAQIVAMLPFDRNSQGTAKVDQYNSLFISICEHYGVPYVDLRECGISNADLPDGTHPDATGMDYITAAVMDVLMSNCYVEAGEHIVHSVTHNLTGAKSSLSYYKGISHGNSFVTTITGENLKVTVTMGGVDVTSDYYANGVFSVENVTDDIVINAAGIEKTVYEDYLQQLPENFCSGTNLWTALVPINLYYTGSGWGNTAAGSVYSVTIPVAAGDQIWATSFQKSGTNGGSRNGIRLTWFDENGVLESVSPDNVYAEFSADGYLTAPEGAIAVNVVMWNGNESNEIYIINRDHTYENGSCTACGAAQPGPIITKQPESVQQEIGKKFSATVEAEGEGLTYQWYYSNNGGKSFAASSFKSKTYAMTMASYCHNRQIYCVVTDANGNSVQTDTVTITRPPVELAIIEQPRDVQVEIGQKAAITVNTQGDGLTYQWYYKNKGDTAFRASGFTGKSYTMTMAEFCHNRQVYCVITDAYGNQVTTEVATMSRPPVALTIVTQPQDVQVKIGEKARITVNAQGDGLTYQWYYKNKGDTAFRVSGFTGKSYTMTMAEFCHNRQIYCVITDAYGNQVTTEVATMSRPPVALTIVTQPQDVQVKIGEKARITVDAAGEGLTYQWYYKNKNGADFALSCYNGKTYSMTMAEFCHGRQVYCVITDCYGNTVTTNTATMSRPPVELKILTQPADVSAATGEKFSIGFQAQGEGLTYQWYYKNKGGSTFAVSCFTGSSYSMTMAGYCENRQVYCVITDCYGNTVTTDTATITLTPTAPLLFSAKPAIQQSAPEVTPTPTATPEPIPESTPTPDAATEPTPEATPEATPSPQPDPQPVTEDESPEEKEIVDITDKLNALMEKNARELKKIKAKRGYIYAALYYYVKVTDGGDWDIKRTDEWKFEEGKTYVYQGVEMRMDDPGNIHFGYLGAILFPEEFVCFGAGMNNFLKFGFSSGDMRSYFDDPQDQKMMRWGYAMYKAQN